jgi:transcriptional regulator with XRE-family HTH domain
MCTVTPFGKVVRRHRIDLEMLLGVMAERLKVSASYLSQVESGKKPIPSGFADRAADALGLNSDNRQELRAVAAQSTASFTIAVPRNAPASDRILAGELAHEFARLTPEAKAGISKLLSGER